ncbi:EAL domain-containing protein [Aquabacter spiritensis]|uniref:Diguanylate cyclase (GGDEF)-like protein n=1 Tax=Aquabacter spiritensis TaxID=933073 RepID=A0A4R3LZK5_9HYPH|nr:EAL domain-containing protein [Aquabacter spiritensis]TCT06194.1 diguanylate cyclase (GGDEF)-like protein [Aquabacter spiritensis]
MATILIVDDHAVNRAFLIALLQHRGHRLFEAADGSSALDAARALVPDLVISDVVMPSGDGYELARGLRGDPRLSHIPIIFYTAHYNEREALVLADACGVAHVLTKPAEPERVLQVVDEVLARAGVPAGDAPQVPTGIERDHLRLVTDKLAKTTGALEWTTSRLVALIEMNLQLALERDPAQIASTFCRWTRDLVAAELAVVVLAETGRTPFVAVSGPPQSAVAQAQLAASFGAADGAGGSADPVPAMPLRRMGPAVSAASLGLPEALPAIASALILPVETPARTFGWVCAANKIGGVGFGEDDQRLLTIFAAHVGRLFENFCLFQELSARSLDLEREVRQRAEGQQRLEVQYAVAHILAGSATLDEAAQRALRVVCEGRGFVMGELWEVDWPRERLCQIATWHADDAVARQFAEMARGPLSRSDPGLLPLVWRSGVPQLLPNIASEAVFLRRAQAQALGVTSAVALPVMGGGRVVGVMAFFAASAGGLTPDAVSFFNALGSQIGQFIARRHQEQRIVRLARIQAVLGAVNALIGRASDTRALFDGACQVAVEEGRFVRAEAFAVEPDGRLRSVSVCGASDADEPDTRPGAPRARDQTLLAEALRTSEPAIDNAAHPAKPGAGARAALPLLEASDVRGVLLLEAGVPDFFTPDEIDLVKQTAADVSFAMDALSSRMRLARLAYFDSLTGLPNRTMFYSRLRQALALAGPEGRRVFVAAGNLRNFGSVNTTFGRHAGDEVLREVARRLQANSRFPDHLARISGNEFATFFPESAHAGAEAMRIDRILTLDHARPIVVDGQDVNLHAFAGIAVFPDDGTDAETLLANAETALRRARDIGARVAFFEPRMHEEVARRVLQENRVSRALQEAEFQLHYQPRVELKSRRVVGLEALVRWRNPDGTVDPPALFIPFLEETGRIVEVGRWILRQALEDQAEWARRGFLPLPVAVNVSPVQLREPGFVNEVIDLVAQIEGAPGAAACGLEIEITESTAMSDIARTSAQLKTLRDHGVAIAIDDFGTGHSSLAYLALLPVSMLKIDRSFIATMLEQKDSRTIVEAVISLAHALGLSVVAEGVETRAQAALLERLACDQIQGFLIARPMDAWSVTAFLPQAGRTGAADRTEAR